jgi:hypothetical protein
MFDRVYETVHKSFQMDLWNGTCVISRDFDFFLCSTSPGKEKKIYLA